MPNLNIPTSRPINRWLLAWWRATMWARCGGCGCLCAKPLRRLLFTMKHGRAPKLGLVSTDGCRVCRQPEGEVT